MRYLMDNADPLVTMVVKYFYQVVINYPYNLDPRLVLS